MVRAQISLTEKEYASAKREAERLGISFPELVRRSLRGMILAGDSKPWMVETGDAGSSQNIDEIVYGRKG